MLLGVAEQLNEFVGALPVYGDVNDILEASMLRMKVVHPHLQDNVACRHASVLMCIQHAALSFLQQQATPC